MSDEIKLEDLTDAADAVSPHYKKVVSLLDFLTPQDVLQIRGIVAECVDQHKFLHGDGEATPNVALR